jgi:nucleotide-binding universal stress UspA family protein
MRRVQRILCPTGLKRPDYASLRYAFFMAERFHASLDVIHACASSIPAPRMRFAHPEPRIEQLITDQNLRKRLGDVLRTVTTAVPGRATAHVMDGRPLTAILHAIRRFETDLIVLGCPAQATSSWLFIANVAEQVACAASCAVLSVPERRDVPLQVRGILLPVDFSPSTAAAVDCAAVFARRFNAPIELLHVRRGSQSARSDALECAGAGHAEAQLDDIRDRLRAAGVRLDRATLVDGSAFERIVERTQAEGCDLVVMSTDTRPKNAAMIGPGVLASVRRQAAVPVLSVRTPRSEPLFLNSGWQSEEDSEYPSDYSQAVC